MPAHAPAPTACWRGCCDGRVCLACVLTATTQRYRRRSCNRNPAAILRRCAPIHQKEMRTPAVTYDELAWAIARSPVRLPALCRSETAIGAGPKFRRESLIVAPPSAESWPQLPGKVPGIWRRTVSSGTSLFRVGYLVPSICAEQCRCNDLGMPRPISPYHLATVCRHSLVRGAHRAAPEISPVLPTGIRLGPSLTSRSTR